VLFHNKRAFHRNGIVLKIRLLQQYMSWLIIAFRKLQILESKMSKSDTYLIYQNTKAAALEAAAAAYDAETVAAGNPSESQTAKALA